MLPFRPTAPDLGLQFIEDTPHGWSDTHAAWNGGKYDQWVPNKGRTTMAHLSREDIPFHYALWKTAGTAQAIRLLGVSVGLGAVRTDPGQTLSFTWLQGE